MEPTRRQDDEWRTWRIFFAANRLLLERVERQLQSEAQMSHVHYEILVNLSEAPEHTLRMNRLAERSLCSRSRLTHAVDRLEKAGWVRRIACPTDGRGSFAELTDTGLNALETATPGHIAAVRSLFFQVLTPHQQESLREIGEAIVAHLTSGPMSPP